MVLKFGPSVSQWSIWISKIYNPTDSEHKFHETKIENWLSIGFELESSWLETYSHNHYTMFNLPYDGETYNYLQSPGTILEILKYTQRTLSRIIWIISFWIVLCTYLLFFLCSPCLKFFIFFFLENVKLGKSRIFSTSMTSWRKSLSP